MRCTKNVSVLSPGWFVSAIGVVAAATLSSAASAQSAANASSSPGTLEEVIVTARKREESVQDIPVAISTLSGEEIERLAVTDLRELTQYISSLTFDRGISPGDFRPAIRGLQAEQGRTSVGILIDDIDITSENLQSGGGGFLANPRMLEIERVEVVKGPQSALYGRSAFGGAINYITKRPRLDASEFGVSGEGTSEQGYEIKGSASLPLVEGASAIRLTAFAWDQRGSHKNLKSGDYVGGGDGSGASLTWSYDRGGAVSLFGTAEYTQDTFAPPAAFIQDGNTIVTLGPNGRLVTGATTLRIFAGELVPGNPFYDVNPATGRDYDGTDNSKARATLIADFELNAIDLKSLSSFVRSKFDARQDNDFVTVPTGSPVVGAFQETDRGNTVDQISQEIRLQGGADSRLLWTVGALYWKESIDQREQNDTGLAFAPLSQADVNAFFNRVNQLPYRRFTRDTTHASVFGFAEFAFTPTFSASLEARYVDEKIEYGLSQPNYIFFYGVLPGATPGNPVLSVVAAVNSIDAATVKESYLIPKATVSFRPNGERSFYASVGTGVKPGGFTTGGVINFDSTARYRREELLAYEVGAKTLWADGRLTLNTALFLQDYKDQQVSSQIFNTTLNQLQGVIENAGESTIWGAELELRYQPTADLRFTAAYTYLDAEFDQFQVLSNSATRIAELPDCQLVTFSATRRSCLLDRAGKSPADLPEHRIVATGLYSGALRGDWRWSVDGAVTYVAERFAETSNVVLQSASTRVDTSVGVDNGKFNAALFVRNVFDEDAVTDGTPYIDFRTGFSPNAFGYLPDPRTIGVRAALRF
jgi:iron complex outermembrane recepter protein